MTNSLSTIRTFNAVTNKAGKISTTAGRAQRAISGASAPVQLGLAISGKSAITRKTAVSGFDVVTLSTVLAYPTLDGSQWPDVYALLADQFGYSIESGRGKLACRAMLQHAQHTLDARKTVASSDGVTDGQWKTIQARQSIIDACIDAFTRWDDASKLASTLTDNLPAEMVTE